MPSDRVCDRAAIAVKDPKTAVTHDEKLRIKENLFPLVSGIVFDKPDFPWHRDSSRSGAITASRKNSSQALAVDLFETVKRLPSCDAIVAAWMAELQLELSGPWGLQLECLVPRELLREPRPTQIDAMARSDKALVLFECKFTEQDGGGCSQTRQISRGAHAGLAQCNGSYEPQTNPVNGVRSNCALSGKGIRYWDFVPDVMNLDSAETYQACPFAGGWYQWMRNLVAARAIGNDRGIPSAFVVVYADGPFPMARKVRSEEWARLARSVAGRAVPFREVSFRRLVAVARDSALDEDQKTLEELDCWIARKIDTVVLQSSGR